MGLAQDLIAFDRLDKNDAPALEVLCVFESNLDYLIVAVLDLDVPVPVGPLATADLSSP